MSRRITRRAFVSTLASGFAITALSNLVAVTASALPATPVAVGPGATATHFVGAAFDVCTAPSRNSMRAWLESPYRAVGIYISGRYRACSQEQLTPEWIREVAQMGWRFLPLHVGLQAPCADERRFHYMSSDPAAAAEQGAEAAAEAVRAAADLGILPGSAVYSDVEAFDIEDIGCTEVVRSYWSGWTRALHRAGYRSGVYGSLRSGVRALADTYTSDAYARPDAVWGAWWNNTTDLAGWPGVPDTFWASHQRVKQYRGDGTETFGGVSLNTDRNWVDAPVATVAYPYPLTTATAARTAGTTLQVICQLKDRTGAWDKLTDGAYVRDEFVDGGAAKPFLPVCTTPVQVAAAVASLRAGPATAARVLGTLPS